MNQIRTKMNKTSIDKTHVYQLLKQIPKGQITTYKILADYFNTKAYRGIGQILKRNPNAPEVPCHRVIKSNGELGGYAGTQIYKKIELLKKEGLDIQEEKIINYKQKLFSDFR